LILLSSILLLFIIHHKNFKTKLNEKKTEEKGSMNSWESKHCWVAMEYNGNI